MNKESINNNIISKHIVIREDYIFLTGDYISAAILNQYMEWYRMLCEKDWFDGWIRRETKSLVKDLLGIVREDQIVDGLKLLVNLEYLISEETVGLRYDSAIGYQVNFDKLFDDKKKAGLLFSTAD